MPLPDIIDAHHHVWRQADQPWLNGPMVPRIFGPYEALRRDYPIGEYLDDIKNSGVVASVYVQTNWAPERCVEEVAWVESTAEAHGFPHAIVGFADLAEPALPATLNAMQLYPRLKGVRQQLHWHQNPAYRFAPRPDVMADEDWRQGFAQLSPRGLLFELQVFTSQMAAGADLARAFPGTTFVLEHVGMLEDLSDTGRAAWRAGMRKLADCPNVYVKLSALGTFVHRATLADIQPIIRDAVTLFGAARCLWGSNFPIEKLWTDYATLVGIVREAVSEFPAGEQRQILSETAARLYGLG
ncbi:MAG TPA: amidohydrolase family protein [Xanthobacteraceae bacterium]|jgi:predicted TIM-barrel fold metal-dependent hydrolase